MQNKALAGMLGVVMALCLTAGVQAQSNAFLWDGSHWAQVSPDGKAGYVFGFGNLADFEMAASKDKAPCVSRAFVDELKSKTVTQIVQTVDKFYQDHPDKVKTSVIEVVLRQCTTVCPAEAPKK
jgi:hypothetical protein